MSKIKDMKLRYKVVAGVATGAAVLGMAGGAFAYFTGSGSGTGTANVGGTATWSVAKTGVSGSMYPGAGSSVVTFTVTNNGTGYEAIESGNLSAVVNADTATPSNITQGGTALAGCKNSWFGVTSVGAPSSGYGTTIAPNSSETVAVTVAMSDSGTNQDVCKNATPDVTLTVAHS